MAGRGWRIGPLRASFDSGEETAQSAAWWEPQATGAEQSQGTSAASRSSSRSQHLAPRLGDRRHHGPQWASGDRGHDRRRPGSAQVAALADRRLKVKPKELLMRCTAGSPTITAFSNSILDSGMRWMRRSGTWIVKWRCGFSHGSGGDGRQGQIFQLIDQLATLRRQPAVGVTILSEMGADMSRFETAGHLVAWAGICSGQDESAVLAFMRPSPQP